MLDIIVIMIIDIISYHVTRSYHTIISHDYTICDHDGLKIISYFLNIVLQSATPPVWIKGVVYEQADEGISSSQLHFVDR